jgi:hypothetical protein
VGWVAEFLSKPIVTGFVLGLTAQTTKADKGTVAAIQKKLNPGAREAFKDAYGG